MDETSMEAEGEVIQQVNEVGEHVSLENSVERIGAKNGEKSSRKVTKRRKRKKKARSRGGDPIEAGPRSQRGLLIDRRRSHLIHQKQSLYFFYRATGCIFCGEKHPACLELHHIIRRKGDEPPVTVVLHDAKASLETFKAELAKTIPACANCHKKLHWRSRRLKWIKKGKPLPYYEQAWMRGTFEPQGQAAVIALWHGWDEIERNPRWPLVEGRGTEEPIDPEEWKEDDQKETLENT